MDGSQKALEFYFSKRTWSRLEGGWKQPESRIEWVWRDWPVQDGAMPTARHCWIWPTSRRFRLGALRRSLLARKHELDSEEYLPVSDLLATDGDHTGAERSLRQLCCPSGGRAMPVRKHLVLVLLDRESFGYVCAGCGSPVGKVSARVSPTSAADCTRPI